MSEPTVEQLHRWKQGANEFLLWVFAQTAGSVKAEVEAHLYCEHANVSNEDVDGMLKYFLFANNLMRSKRGMMMGKKPPGEPISLTALGSAKAEQLSSPPARPG